MIKKQLLIDILKWQFIAVTISIIIYLTGGGQFIGTLITSLIMTNSIAIIIYIFHHSTIKRYNSYKRRKEKTIYWGILSVSATAVGTLIGLIPMTVINKYTYAEVFKHFYLRLVLFAFIICIIVIIIEIAYSNLVCGIEQKVKENEKLKRLNVQSQLKTLQAKVNPHFLFNTLNTILNLTDKDPDKVQQIVLNLSEIYRKILYLPNDQLITLKLEFDLISKYLEIEKIRFGSRLEYSLNLKPEYEHIKIPPLLIEPLVENAVIHGISPKKGGGKIFVGVKTEGEKIHIKVNDTGSGLTDKRIQEGSGFGLLSIRERLKLMYHDKAQLKIRENSTTGVCVELEIPYED